MKKRLLTAAVAFCIFCINSTAESAPVQWKIEDGGNGHWYEAVLSPNTNWTNANQLAANRTGEWYLATINSQQENAFVLNLFNNNSNYWVYSGHSSLVGDVYAGPWINGSLSSGGWSWSTGEPFSFSAWGPYEPFGNGDKIFFSQFGSTANVGWNDVPDSYVAPGFIVETSVPLPASLLFLGSGIVVLATTRFTKRKKR